MAHMYSDVSQVGSSGFGGANQACEGQRALVVVAEDNVNKVGSLVSTLESLEYALFGTPSSKVGAVQQGTVKNPERPSVEWCLSTTEAGLSEASFLAERISKRIKGGL